MQFKNTYNRFGVLSQLFHWSIALMLTAQFYLIWVYENLPDADPSRGNYMFLHKAMGVTVLIVGLLWIIWRLFNVQPAPIPNAYNWQSRLAKIIHTLLFIIIIFSHFRVHS